LTATRRIAIATALVAATALTIGIGSATAATACAQRVIDDWYKDGRVDGTYELHCYEEAIDALPEDVVIYSSAKGDIERALQDALRKGTPAGEPEPTEPEQPGEEPRTGGGVSPSGPDDPEQPSTGPSAGDDKGPGDPEALPGEATSSDASSVPLPLIVLAALALLLLAAGGAGYLNRRVQARRVDGGTGEPPSNL
jgi:hypothetical protein